MMETGNTGHHSVGRSTPTPSCSRSPFHHAQESLTAPAAASQAIQPFRVETRGVEKRFVSQYPLEGQAATCHQTNNPYHGFHYHKRMSRVPFQSHRGPPRRRSGHWDRSFLQEIPDLFRYSKRVFGTLRLIGGCVPVGRTIADLTAAETIRPEHVAETISSGTSIGRRICSRII